jgi:TetR/AcrR family transcriptional regulator, mexJK operon transcriptional repressor
MQEGIEETRPRGGRDDKREAIVRIAQQAFLAEGYAETSMSSVAAKVGGSKATLYNYFKSKEELFAAICERKCEHFRQFLDEAEIGSGGDLRATLTNFGEHFVEFVLSDDSVATFRMAIAEAARFPEIGQALYNSGVRQNHRRMAEFLEHAKASGQLRSDADIDCASEQFFDLCLSGIHRRRLWNVTPCPTGDEIRGNVARAVDTFMRAFAA